MTTFHWTGRDDREDGPLARRIYHAVNANAPRAVIGFASDEGVRRNQGRVGAASGPNAIRKALSGLPIGTSFSGFADLGDVRVQDGDLEGGQERLAQTLTGALQTYDRVLVLGGGHETAFGSYLGLRGARPDARIGIVNFDAHLDIRQIGANGPSSGTPFNQIRAREGDTFDYLCIGVAEEANTQALLERANAWGVRRVMDHELRDNNHKAFEMIDALIMRNDLLYLTIDLDVLPHYQAPGVSAPAVRGVPLAMIEALIGHCLERVHAHGRALPICDIVELNPHVDQQTMTARTAAYLARQLLTG